MQKSKQKIRRGEQGFIYPFLRRRDGCNALTWLLIGGLQTFNRPRCKQGRVGTYRNSNHSCINYTMPPISFRCCYGLVLLLYCDCRFCILIAAFANTTVFTVFYRCLNGTSSCTPKFYFHCQVVFCPTRD
jgi:hypothetical protein